MTDKYITRMEIIIDSREKDIITNLTSSDISNTIKTLDVADIEIIGPQSQRFLFERKTIKDLAASLRDGRFKDQKDRLLGVIEREPKTSIAYILEGTLRGGKNDIILGRINVGMLKSLLYTIQMRYRIPVINTFSVKDTTRWIIDFYKHIQKNPGFMPVGSGSNAGCSSYKTLMPMPSKNRKNDPRSITIGMLTTLSGISGSISTKIVDSICREEKVGLFNIIRKCSREDFEKKLGEIKIGKRRISKKIRKNLCDVLYD